MKLDLQNNWLSGEIPSSLGNLKKLQFLTLCQNNLSGAIPESLSNLTSLINLQLESSNLTSQIPNGLFQVCKYNFTGNNLNCGTTEQHRCTSDGTNSGIAKKPKVGTIVGVVIGLIILLVAALLFSLYKVRHKVYRHEVFVDVEGEVDRRIAFGQLKRFAWRELHLATDNFSEKNVLEQGGFGKVNKGVIADNTKIVVKRLKDSSSPGGDAAFQREVEMISVAVHRNLLRLIGFCTTPTERLLVYPFMENLSVAYRLREVKADESILDWPTRKKVALGAACEPEYLYEHCNPKIIHRDVKVANVLLDEDFEAIVGDFFFYDTVVSGPEVEPTPSRLEALDNSTHGSASPPRVYAHPAIHVHQVRRPRRACQYPSRNAPTREPSQEVTYPETTPA